VHPSLVNYYSVQLQKFRRTITLEAILLPNLSTLHHLQDPLETASGQAIISAALLFLPKSESRCDIIVTGMIRGKEVERTSPLKKLQPFN
jgi:hypothetical protein